MYTAEVCLTPELIHQFELKEKLVVVVDIFRATSCMVTGLAHGIESIKPVETVEECMALGEEGFVKAGERGGQKITGFDMGNSPFEYMDQALKGKSVAVTTTNGTRTIAASTQAHEVLIGAFLNLESLADYLGQANRNIVIHCAGWQGTVNIEDTLFAGALIAQLNGHFQYQGDPALMAYELYKANAHDPVALAQASSHAQRLSGFGAEKDLEYCMQQNKYETIPVMKGDTLTMI